MNRPTVIDLNLDEYNQRLHYSSFMINLNKHNGSHA